MFVLLVRAGEDEVLRRSLKAGTFVVGGGEGVDVALAGPGVSARHAEIAVTADKVVVRDLGSFTGTFLAGRELPRGRSVAWPSGAQLTIGDYSLTLEPADDREVDAAPPPEPSPATSIRDPAVDALIGELLDGFYRRMDLRKMEAEGLDEAALRRRVEETVASLVADLPGPLPVPAEALARELLHEILGLGPVEEFLSDPSITEVMVNGPERIYIERQGKIVLTGRKFRSDEHVLRVIERIVAGKGRRIDEQSPYVDTRLDDGSRVHAIIPPLALTGPTLTIRKFPDRHLTVADLVKYGSMNREMAYLLKVAVQYRQNLIVSGGTGSGKTTLLNVLSSFIPTVERIVTIEDSAELRLTQPHWVRLESRPPNIEGKGQVTIRDLVRNSLRMRPDRVVVGECRGGEALDMLQAMNTGHDGSMTTLHANSPRDGLARLETMCLMSGMELPLRAIREQVASAVNVIVQQSRFSDGQRKVVSVSEVTGMEGDVITTQEIFVFRKEGVGEGGRIVGRFEATGIVPKFVDRLLEEGVKINTEIFTPPS